jgi:hypothetical protein
MHGGTRGVWSVGLVGLLAWTAVGAASGAPPAPAGQVVFPTVAIVQTVAPFATPYLIPTLPLVPTPRIPTVLVRRTPTPTATPTSTPPPAAFPPVAPPRLPEAPAAARALAPQPVAYQGVRVTPALPPEALCLREAVLRPTGTFLGYSVEVGAPAGEGACVVPAGLVLRSLDGRQDLLVVATVALPPAAGEARTARVYAVCLDASRPGPEPDAPYAVAGLVERDTALGRLVWALPELVPDDLTAIGLQAAVWAITNDLAGAQLQQVFPGATAGDLASARLLLERAGVDPAGRALFRSD